MIGAVRVEWRPREAPLTPCAVAAGDKAAAYLVERLLAWDDEALARLRGAASADFVVVLGESAELPWVDGARYLGRDPAAPSLLLPTNREPDRPIALVERAVLRAGRGLGAPVAVIVDERRLMSLSAARPLERTRLAAWLEARR